MFSTSVLGADFILHTVAKGQTLGRIAKRYNTTVESIREINHLEPKQPIKPGLVLVIPKKGKEAEAEKKAASLLKENEINKPDAVKKKNGKGKDTQQAKEHSGTTKPKRPGLVRFMSGGSTTEIQVLTRQGKLIPKSLDALSKVLRHFPSNQKTRIDPRLATLIGLVSNHFGGRTLHVVSGYRPYSPTQYTPHSNHNLGKAMDFTIDGVSNTTVRDFCRTFRNAGVGYYPNSTFVHLDTRSVKTYWVDYSRSGEPPQYSDPASRLSADEAASDVNIESEKGSMETQNHSVENALKNTETTDERKSNPNFEKSESTPTPSSSTAPSTPSTSPKTQPISKP